MLELSPVPLLVEPVDSDWHKCCGESPDNSAISSLQLIHRVIARFPDLSKRYRSFVGTAGFSSAALLIMASIAIGTRLKHGQSPEQILLEITREEIVNANSRLPSKA